MSNTYVKPSGVTIVSRYLVRWNEHDTERYVNAISPGDAAEAWASIWDAESAEYAIVKGEEAHVVVTLPERPGAEWRFVVRGEAVPVYTAREKKDGVRL